jgi:hypothetical protein
LSSHFITRHITATDIVEIRAVFYLFPDVFSRLPEPGFSREEENKREKSQQ